MNTLLPQHAALIDASAISSEVAAARGYRSISDPAEAIALGFADYQARVPGLLVPVHDVDGKVPTYQIRPDNPRIDKKGKAIKYETPAGARMVLDIPPAVLPVLGDPSVPLIITEGVRKADSAVSQGGNCIALLGVWNWRGTDEMGEKGPLADLDRINFYGRIVSIAYDSDVMRKPEVRRALNDLTVDLRGRGAVVRHIFLPDAPDGGKQGLDDYLAAGHTMRDVYDRAREPDDAISEQSAWDRFRALRTDLYAVLDDGVTAPAFLADPIILKAKVHGFAGPPESGKTMVVLGAAILPVLREGGRVMFLDEEGGDFEIASRLVAMGASEEEIGRLDYFAFKVAGSLDEMAATLHEGALRERYELVVFDSASKLFAKFRLDENSNSDATRLMTALIVPLARLYGCAVVFLDHVTKSDEGGRYGRGASAKLADVDVQWSVQITAPLSRTSHGRIVLTRQKDRTASVPGSVRYIAGGDAEGRLAVELEGSSATPPARMNSTDREMLGALHGASNQGKRFAEWMDAAGKSPSTFKEARRRLMDAGHAEQRDDFYRVTDTGLRAIFPERYGPEGPEGGESGLPGPIGDAGPDKAETGADGLYRPIGDAGPEGPEGGESGPSGPPAPITSRPLTARDLRDLFPDSGKAAGDD